MAYNIEKYPLHWALGGTATDGGLEQNAYELEKLCAFIEAKGIKTYLEIGIAKGLLMRFMRDEMNLKVMGITPDEHPLHEGLEIVYKKSQKVMLAPITHFDLIFVDGAHDYDSVKSDYERFKNNCTYMAFHDLCGHRGCEGVAKLWSEIKYHHQYWTFISENKEQQSGIGIIKICG